MVSGASEVWGSVGVAWSQAARRAAAHDAAILSRPVWALLRRMRHAPLYRDIALLRASLGGVGLSQATRAAPAVYWAAWADALTVLRERCPVEGWTDVPDWRQSGKLAEQRVFGFKSFGAPGADVLWCADGGAECNEATHLGGLVAMPDLGPKVGDPERRRPTVLVEDVRLAQVSGYACVPFYCARHEVQGGGRWRALGLGRAGGRKGRQEKPHERLPQLRIYPA